MNNRTTTLLTLSALALLAPSSVLADDCTDCPQSNDQYIDYYDMMPVPASSGVTLENIAPTLYNLNISNTRIGEVPSIPVFGDDFSPNNIVYTDSVTFTPGQVIDAVAWDLTSTAPSPAVLSDLRIAIVNEDGVGIVLDPYDQVSFPGQFTGTSSGLVELDPTQLSFPVTGSGAISFVFFTEFDAVVGGQDMVIDHGTITLRAVPTPGAIALAGLGGLMVTRRRRS